MGMPTPVYVYRARFVSLHDGDTVKFMRDMGDDLYQGLTVRLKGINTPEVVGETKAAGLAAKAYALAWFDAAGTESWPFSIETHLDKREKYGRLLARVWRVVDGAELNADLLASGHAVPFMVDG
jgi:endonuclease YncB( thermonuclease family)